MIHALVTAQSVIAAPANDYGLALPEIIMLSAICAILIIDLFVSQNKRIITYLLTQATLIGLAIYTIHYILHISTATEYTFNDSFIRDFKGDVLKIAIYIICFLVFLYSKDYLRERRLFKGEYFVIGLFGVLGMMIMVSAASMLILYLGLEVMSLSLYAMVAFNRKSSVASEAAMKYFVLGAIASGMLLYGISIIYGVTGHIGIGEISSYLGELAKSKTTMPLSLVFGLVFILIGIAFKLGAVPFHMWVPDIYHGAPTSVTLYIGTITKIAAFAMVVRLLVDGLGPMHKEWTQILVVLSLLSLAVGNIVAIAQTNIKRMLAYSTISHIGFLLLGFIAANENGYSASMFYVITYAIIAAAAFGLIILFSRKGFESDNLNDFKGLNERHPWYAFMMLIVMFSLAGVPPTVGFFAKLHVLQALIKADIGLTWLAIVAVSFAIIGAFYYIRVIKLMYFDKPVTEDNTPITAGADMHIVLSVNCLLALGLGLFPGALIYLCSLVFTPAV